MNPKILTVGSAYYAMDLEVPAIPPAGGIAKVKNFAKYPDGSGVNTAVALQKLEADCILVASLGNDQSGKMMQRFLESRLFSMTTVHIERTMQQGACFSLDDMDGGRRKLFYEGANAKLTPDLVEDAFSFCPDAVIVNGDMPQEIVYTAILAAETHQIPSLVDLRGKQAARLSLEQIGSGTILLMDQYSAHRFCGMRVDTVDDCLKACISLAGKVKSKYFIIRMEGKGAFSYNGKYYYFVPNYDFIPSDERGGKEYYNAALLLRYMMEDDIRMACEFAAVAETVTMLRPGGAANFPDYADIRKFILDNELDTKLLID